MKYCYKCTTAENLSVKKHDRRGNKIYICKPCRNQAYKKYVSKKEQSEIVLVDDAESWNKRAKESYDRILAKYGTRVVQ